MRIYQRIKKVVVKYYPFSYFLILAVVTFAVLYQTIFFYFWVDDWDLFLKVTHPDLTPWGLAPGPFGSGPYRYLHTPFYFLYPLLGLNAHAYFAVGIFIYFIAAVSVFLLTLEITRKKTVALGTGVIFASMPYIGSYTVTHLSNSYQMFMTIILSCFTVLFLHKFYQTQKFRYYLYCILFFVSTIEFMFLRAHGLLFMLLACAFLFGEWKINLKSILRISLPLVPLILIYQSFYKQVSGGNSSAFQVFFSTMIHGQFSVGYLSNFFGTFSNILIPNKLIMEIYSFIGGSLNAFMTNGILTIFFVIFVGAIWSRRKKHFKFYLLLIVLQIFFFFFSEWILTKQLYVNIPAEKVFSNIFGFGLFSIVAVVIKDWIIEKKGNAKVIIFAIVWIVGQYIGYFIASPATSFLTSEDRYLTVATVGSAMLIGIIFSKLSFKKVSLYPAIIFFISFIYFLFMNGVALENIKYNSKPIEAMYAKITKEIKKLPKDAIILIDMDSDPIVVDRVKRSNPASAFAIFYNLPDRANIAMSFDKVLAQLKKSNAGVGKIVAFYVNRDGVINNTEQVKDLLSKPSTALVLEPQSWKTNVEYSTQGTFITQSISKKIGQNTAGLNPSIEGRINFKSMVPSQMSISMIVSSSKLQKDHFPYYMLISQDSGNNGSDFLAESSGDIKYQQCPYRTEILEEESQRQEFLKSAKVTADSYWPDAEDTYLSDGRLDVNWLPNINTWRASSNANIDIDLGQEKPVQRLMWVNYAPRSTPSNYTIAVSTDKVTWNTVRKVSNNSPRQNEEIVYEQFPKTNARYVRMSITGTVANIAVSMSEIWVDSLSGSIDAQQKEDIIASPLSCLVNTQEEFSAIIKTLGYVTKTRIWWKTDREEGYSLANSMGIPLYVDGVSHTYHVNLPAGGMILESLKLDSFQIPVEINIIGSQIRSLTLDELNAVDYGRSSVTIQ